MSDRIHELEHKAIHAEYDAIKYQIRESRGLPCEHCAPPAVPCGCALSVKCAAAEIGKQMKASA